MGMVSGNILNFSLAIEKNILSFLITPPLKHSPLLFFLPVVYSFLLSIDGPSSGFITYLILDGPSC